MTVPPVAFYAFAWLLAIAIFLMWFFSKKLADARDRCDTLQRISKVNEQEHRRELAIFVQGILIRASVTDKKLPPLTSSQFKQLLDLYDDPQLMGDEIPAQITTDHDDRPAVYWKKTNRNELTAYELARLWLAGIL